MENVYIMDHPLIQHKISMLRDKNTGTNEFRKLVEEIAVLMAYEAFRDLPMEDVEVETPIETCQTPFIAGKKLAVVPVLRAGLGMVNGILTLVPSAKVGHVGLYRDPVTHENRFNGLDLLRLAIPRRVYTDNHMNVIAAALKNVYERRESITHGVRIAWEAPLMRHFTVQLERL